MSGRMTRKRARVEAEEQIAGLHPPVSLGNNSPSTRIAVNNVLRQDDELWYEDGTIVITAQDVAFKVYKGPLIEHSPVFNDMLSLPQPSTSTTDASCPIIPLHDSPDELRHVLQVLMPSKRIK